MSVNNELLDIQEYLKLFNDKSPAFLSKAYAGLLLDKIAESIGITMPLYNYRTNGQVIKNLSFSFVCKICRILHQTNSITVRGASKHKKMQKSLIFIPFETIQYHSTLFNFLINGVQRGFKIKDSNINAFGPFKVIIFKIKCWTLPDNYRTKI